MSSDGSRTSRRKRAVRKNIDQVNIEETFNFLDKKGDVMDSAYYISAEINHKKYYGVLTPQEALVNASDLHFESEGMSLAINRRMEALRSPKQSIDEGNQRDNVSKRPSFDASRQVQKFKYVEPTKNTTGYRVILATYANLWEACGEDMDMFMKIKDACEVGGNFVGRFFYQFEKIQSTLKFTQKDDNAQQLHTSMSFSSFLLSTPFPCWYPLRNLGGKRAKILNLLNLKQDGNQVIYDTNQALIDSNMTATQRKNLRVCVVGGGLSGLGCCQELLRLSKQKNIKLDVILYEGRDRIGGRCATNYTSFKTPNGNNFPVETGAAFIHGVTGNPVSILARASGVHMRKASEHVKLLSGNMKQANEVEDKKISKLFDDILDAAAKKSWLSDEFDSETRYQKQKALRFYADAFSMKEQSNDFNSLKSDVASHRFSSDSSVKKLMMEELKNVGIEMTLSEINLLEWNIKHAEYSFGANLDDLSMRYWDVDEKNAFEGPHVQMREGYSKVAQTVLKKCQESEAFQLYLTSRVEKIDYDLKCFSRENSDKSMISISDTCKISTSEKEMTCDFAVCTVPLGVLKKAVESKENSNSILKFEPTLPSAKVDSIKHVGYGLLNKVFIQFPHSFWRKDDTKEVLRGTPYLGNEELQFGNSSGLNPHHYMFFDVSFDIDNPQKEDDPCILHTLISGLDAVESEKMSDENIVQSVMKTLRHLFSDISIPEPLAYHVSRWGNDSFSFGSYSFLPPGSSDEDYKSLQSPVCADGDLIELGEHNHTMRLFFAGEHTSANFPSLTHGAYISGVKAAHEIFKNLKKKSGSSHEGEQEIPIIRYRQNQNQGLDLSCNLCKRVGGDMVAFQRDRRYALVHRSCIEFSPDVSFDGRYYKNVFKCINRGNNLKCAKCKSMGATIGCHEPNCNQNYHYDCCDGWDFEKKGKEFHCVLHRKVEDNTSRIGDNEKKNSSILDYQVDNDDEKDGLTNSQVNNNKNSSNENLQKVDLGVIHEHETNTTHATNTAKTIDKTKQESEKMEFKEISIGKYRYKRPIDIIQCHLCCGTNEDKELNGKLKGFQLDSTYALVHENCLKFSNIGKMSSSSSRKNIFDIISAARPCFYCHRDGASIQCSMKSCFRHFHLGCLKRNEGHLLEKQPFQCFAHIQAPKETHKIGPRKKIVLTENKCFELNGRTVSHDLFHFGKTRENNDTMILLPKKRKLTSSKLNQNIFVNKRHQPEVTNNDLSGENDSDGSDDTDIVEIEVPLQFQQLLKKVEIGEGNSGNNPIEIDDDDDDGDYI